MHWLYTHVFLDAEQRKWKKASDEWCKKSGWVRGNYDTFSSCPHLLLVTPHLTSLFLLFVLVLLYVFFTYFTKKNFNQPKRMVYTSFRNFLKKVKDAWICIKKYTNISITPPTKVGQNKISSKLSDRND